MVSCLRHDTETWSSFIKHTFNLCFHSKIWTFGIARRFSNFTVLQFGSQGYHRLLTVSFCFVFKNLASIWVKQNDWPWIYTDWSRVPWMYTFWFTWSMDHTFCGLSMDVRLVLRKTNSRMMHENNTHHTRHSWYKKRTIDDDRYPKKTCAKFRTWTIHDCQIEADEKTVAKAIIWTSLIWEIVRLCYMPLIVN